MTRIPTAARVRAEFALAVISGLLGALTVVFRDWLEVFGWDPDHSSGTVEVGIVLSLLTVAALLAVAARGHRRVLLDSAPV